MIVFCDQLKIDFFSSELNDCANALLLTGKCGSNIPRLKLFYFLPYRKTKVSLTKFNRFGQMQILLLKLLISPVLTAIMVLVGKKHGHTIGGLLVGLPFVAGPIAFVIALQNGNSFASNAAKGTLLGIISLALFTCTYAWTAKRCHWLLSVAISWPVFLIATFLFKDIDVSIFTAYSLAIAILFIILLVFPKHEEKPQDVKMPKWDIPFRMALVTTFLIGLTYVSKSLGPHLSGLLTPFPIYGTIFAVTTHHFYGHNATISLQKGAIIGLFSFATFFFTVGIFISTLGVGLTFIIAIFAALAIQGAYLLLATNVRFIK
jgi:hypothetical protein